jgi:hypothetical protein
VLLYVKAAMEGLPLRDPLYRLGDVRVKLTENGLPATSSFFKMGLFRLHLGYSREHLARSLGDPSYQISQMFSPLEEPMRTRDHLAHYVAGTPFFSMYPVFYLAHDNENGDKLKYLLFHLYEHVKFLVYERLHDQAELINQNTFDEYFSPAIGEDEYISGAERFLSNCLEIRKITNHSKVNSLIKPDYSDAFFNSQRHEFLENTRDQSYITK